MQLKNGVRNIIDDGFGMFKAVRDFTIFDGFSCGDADLDEFILQDAQKQQEELLCITYAYFVLEDSFEIPLAFASLSNSAIKIKPSHPLRKAILKNVPYQDFPAVKIGRLGVRKGLQGIGLGGHILNLIKDFFITDNRTGCRFLTVDAYNYLEITNFYKKNSSFFYHQNDEGKKTRIMYYDLLRPMLEP